MKGIFGPRSKALEKLGKLVYWNVKFKNKSPWPLPKQVPNDQFLLGQLAVERITSVDVKTEISVYQVKHVSRKILKQKNCYALKNIF